MDREAIVNLFGAAHPGGEIAITLKGDGAEGILALRSLVEAGELFPATFGQVSPRDLRDVCSRTEWSVLESRFPSLGPECRTITVTPTTSFNPRKFAERLHSYVEKVDYARASPLRLV